MPSTLITLNSNDQRANGTPSNFTFNISPDIYLDEAREYKIGLSQCIISHAWYNISISKGNNIFRYSSNGGLEFVDLVIPNGYYNIERFNLWIASQVGASNITFALDALTQKMKVTLAADHQVQFISGMHTFFGFNLSQIVTTNTIAPHKGLIQKVRSIHVHCNLVERNHSYVNGRKSDLLYASAPLSVEPFTLTNIVQYDRYYTRLRYKRIERVKIQLTDQDNEALEFDADDHVTVVLLIKDQI